MAEEGTPSPPAPAPSTEPAKGEDKTFTQADVDRIVQDRLNRDRAKVADYDDLKAKAAKFDELDAANQSELEKAQSRADAAEKAAAAALARAQAADVRSKVTAVASAAGAIDIDAVIALLPQDAVTVGNDGQVTGAEDAVKALLESKPYLVGKGTTVVTPAKNGSADGGARGNGDGPRQVSDLSGMNHREIAKARREGRLDDLLAGKTT